MNTLEFVDFRELTVLYAPKWWDAPRWWLVRLLGGSCPYDTVRVTRVPVNGKDFAERLFKQRRAFTEQFRREPTKILMGAEDYEELMNSPTIRDAFTMYSSFNYGRHEVYGLTVQVVPWLRGMVVMPEDRYYDIRSDR